MTSSIGQLCINVRDLGAAVAFYTSLGLECTSRTEIPQAFEAILEHGGGHGGKVQLAQQKEPAEPFDLGTAFSKLSIHTPEAAGTYDTALGAGATAESEPEQLDRGPVTVGSVHDLDGYLVEIVERHPWPDGAPTDAPWIGRCCLHVTDIDATVAFYELLGLECTSRTEVPRAHEAILENPHVGGRLQLVQQRARDEPLRMGSMWKLYVDTDDVVGLHRAAVAAGHPSLMEPMRLDRWPVTISFLGDPDGYRVELVQRHPDR